MLMKEGAAIDFAVQFRNHAPEVAAFGQVHGMAAIRAEDHIVRCEHVANPDRHCLLPDRQVHRALDLVAGIRLHDRLLDAPDAAQRAVQARGQGRFGSAAGGWSGVFHLQ